MDISGHNPLLKHLGKTVKMYRKQAPQRVVNTQELRRSNAAGPHSSVKYNRNANKYPTTWSEEALEIDEFFFWEEPLNNLEEDLD